LTAAPPPLPDLLSRMDARIADFEHDRDARRVFLTVYRTMTGAMVAAIDDDRFLDPAFAAALTLRFADLYFDADESWCHVPEHCPAPWRCAFEVAASPRVTALEHALLGINAHIVYDLPQALADTLRTFGDTGREATPAQLARRRFDYEVVNQVLVETVDHAQDVLAERFFSSARWLDTLALRFDELLAELLLRTARTQGWHSAVALAHAADDRERDVVRRQLERLTLDYARRIDVTQHVPTGVGRRMAARWRAPFVPELTAPPSPVAGRWRRRSN
jgi:hypothetical protein